jgi:hypothetical protein
MDKIMSLIGPLQQIAALRYLGRLYEAQPFIAEGDAFDLQEPSEADCKRTK